MKGAMIVVAALAMTLVGCREKQQLPPKPTVLLVTESHLEILKSLADEFVRIEGGDSLRLYGTTSREAIVAMLNDSVRNICVDRPLNEEEHRVAAAAEMKITENKLGDDALVVIVHELNPLKRIGMKSLAKIVNGETRTWSAVPEAGWSGGLDFVLTGRNSGAYELLKGTFFHVSGDLALTKLVATQREAMEYVSSHPQAISIVSLPVAEHRLPNVRLVPLEATRKTAEGEYLEATQHSIYLSLYPLRYSLYLYTSERTLERGSAFSTFALKLAGQKVIQNSGLVPATVPSRPIQITSE